MRLTLVLLKQHCGEHFVKHWKTQGRRLLIDSGAIKTLVSHGCVVEDAEEVAFGKKRIAQDGDAVKSQKIDQIISKCFHYKDSNVLVDGLRQAKVLTNTVELEPGKLPEGIFDDPLLVPDNLDTLVQNTIKSSLLYDTEQMKLPIRKDPLRPAWKFPRDYGITDRRRNLLLCTRLIDLCSRICAPKRVLENAKFSVVLPPWEQSDPENLHPIVLSLRADLLLLGDKLVQPIADRSLIGQIESIDPLLPTVSIEESAIPHQLDYPLTSSKNESPKYIHFAISHYNETEVANLYELPVTDEQFFGRSLLKAYTFAAAQARYLYGDNVVDLPEPVVIRCLHTDSKIYQFSVFQLNSLSPVGKEQNFLWQEAPQNLYSACGYVEGRPQLVDYNPKIFRTLMAFYNNKM